MKKQPRGKSGARTRKATVLNVRKTQQAIGSQQVSTQINHFHAPVDPRSSGSYDTRFRSLLPSYLQQLIAQVKLLDLSSLARNTADEQADQAPPLAEIYVSLDVLCGRERMDSRTAAEAPESAGERQSAVAFVSQHRRVALLGDPGSGKSTLANYLALVLAGEWLQQFDLKALDRVAMESVHLGRLGEDWKAGALLPVRVVLRDFAARPRSAQTPTEQLWTYLQQVMGSALADFVEPLQKHLCDQGGLLILDGYDEVPEVRLDPDNLATDAPTLRDFVKEAIRGFERQYPRVHILLTSRTYAYQDQPATADKRAKTVRLPGFEVTVLAPFSDKLGGQMDQFVDAWYAHHGQRKGHGRLAEGAAGRAARLKAAIRQRPYLRELARRPLLLTLTAALHAWRQAELPESREKLYDESVDLLLYRWEKRKESLDASGQARVQHQSAAAWFRVPQEALLKAFAALAFKAHRNQPDSKGAADIPQTEVVTALMNMKAGPDLPQARVIEYIQDRAGLLLDRGNEVYCFPHRTFQEYLAARHLTLDPKWPRELIQLVRGDVERWREAVLLAGARAAATMPYAAWQLVQKLCSPLSAVEPPWPDGDGRWWLALLAGQLLVETGLGFDPDLDDEQKAHRNHIIKSLGHLVAGGQLPPPDRATAGIALGKLGDPRPGVGLRSDGLPDLAFVPTAPEPALPGGSSVLGETGRDVKINGPYRISRYPVTVEQYRAFEAAGGYDEKNPTTKAWWGEDGWKWKQERGIRGPKDYEAVFQTPNHPRVGVSWYEARAFCAWLTQQLRTKGDLAGNQLIRLPQEAEWEQAARWNQAEGRADNRRFPWGNSGQNLGQRCNCEPAGVGHTSAVGMFPSGAGESGAQDLSGNVWEWCENLDDQGLDFRTLRGGSWYVVYPEGLSCCHRGHVHPDYRDPGLGFRCVVAGVGPA